GKMTDTFNAGLPTDRLEVHWHIDQPYVEKAISFSRATVIALNSCVQEAGTFTVNKYRNVKVGERATYTVSIPNNFKQVKEQDSRIAMNWRFAVRYYFQHLFQAGYAVVELNQNKTESTYYFVKKECLKIGGSASVHD